MYIHAHVIRQRSWALVSFCLLLKRGTTTSSGEEIRETGGWEVVVWDGERGRWERGRLCAGRWNLREVPTTSEDGKTEEATHGNAIVVVTMALIAMVVVSRIPRSS